MEEVEEVFLAGGGGKLMTGRGKAWLFELGWDEERRKRPGADTQYSWT